MTMAMALIPSSPAHAQIKSLIMPGQVIAGHADIEQDCESCHVAFERGRQRDLCAVCHEDVAADISAPSGYHGLFDSARTGACASCHTEHEGRDAQIVELNRQTFDHGLTDFALTGKHTDADCDGCHQPDTKFRDAPHACFDCHQEDDAHDGSLGTDCASCHSPSDWLDVEFDHDTTDYPLIGHHRDAGCLDCHADDSFQDTPTTCYACHAEDDAHDGRSGQQCGNCHSPTGWENTSFDHARDTHFALEGAHSELSCSDCHSEDPFADSLDTACVSCHLEDDNHDGHFGGACDTCHVSSAWETVLFDHDTDTDYPLHGAHTTIACEECHVEPIFDVALESSCNNCHADDDPHEGTEGTACGDCHNESAWPDDVFFDHGLTGFPLLGAHGAAECDACHETKVFRDAPSTCIECHAEDDAHDGRFGTECALCHNPVDWQEWRFDHNTQTAFTLEGAHTSVDCENCHRRPLAAQKAIGERCGDCHRSDDVHDGEFGYDCGRCHTANNFSEVRTIQ